jgi:hypothetical protein
MKNNLFPNLLFLIASFGILYLVFHISQPDSPTLNDQAMTPDLHLKNVEKYAKEHEYERSKMHLEKAIETMRIIESDVDVHSGKIIEKTIKELEAIQPLLKDNAYDTRPINDAIAQALTALSYAELRVSESYAETNKLNKANIALDYGLLHLKHALNFSGGYIRSRELHIYHEMDSLFKSHDSNSMEVTLMLDHLVKELDTLLLEK